MLFTNYKEFFLLLDPFGNIKTSLVGRHLKMGICEIKCSISHLSDESRPSNQIIYVLLYSLLIVISLNLFGNAVTIGTSLGFATLHKSNLFGRQRVWGTIGFGISAFVASRLYAYLKTEYVYICMFIVLSILSIVITSFINLRSKKRRKTITHIDDASVVENLNDFFDNQNTENTKMDTTKVENHLSKILELVPLLKRFDVIVLLSTTFVWGMSSGAIDPVSIRSSSRL